MLWMDKDGSIIIPSILGLHSCGSCVSLRVIFGCSGTVCVRGEEVTVDFGAEIRSKFPSGICLHLSGNLIMDSSCEGLGPEAQTVMSSV